MFLHKFYTVCRGECAFVLIFKNIQQIFPYFETIKQHAPVLKLDFIIIEF